MRIFLLTGAALAMTACATARDAREITPDIVAAGEVDDRSVRYTGYEGTLAPVADTVALDVRLSPGLAHRANHIGDRTGSRGLRAGFATDGFLGEPDLVRLRENTVEELTERLRREGVRVDADAPTVLRVQLVDARPNSPTFEQQANQPSLDFNSFGEGGASFEGELIRAGGERLGAFEYGYYTDLATRPFRVGIWTDADRAVDRMARRVAKELSQG